MTSHFQESEFRCPCCGDSMVSNRLIMALEELREKIGKPIHVTSGKRCAKHNKEVGGTASSKHLTGQAADITTDMPLHDFYLAANSVKSFLDGGIGVSPSGNFLHVDVRNGYARWGYKDGGYCDIRTALEEAKHENQSA